MKNWVLANDYGDEFLLNLDFITSISISEDCKHQKYLMLQTKDIENVYQWSFSSNEECELKYQDLIKLLT
jgi:hypothetical protein